MSHTPANRVVTVVLSTLVVLLLGLIGSWRLTAEDRTAIRNVTEAVAPAVETAKPEPPRHNPRLDLSIDSAPGFEVELLYKPDLEKEGSWVALCAGPGNTLYAADQYGKIYELTPPPLDDFETPLKVRALDYEVGGAQGMCYAFDALYVMVTGRGLERVTDTTGDGRPDTGELIVEVRGEGEHGPHAVTVAPDGVSLLFVCGNHTPLPKITSSRVPRVWAEDQLLPRDNDPRGHAVGVMAPGGYICRVTPDGSEIELLTCGFRNSYDIAVGPNGDIFTYDSDMEWDLGMPWYRPTRLCQALSGVDFGWRNGSGKFSPSLEDSSPGIVDIGPGSPTGVTFGYGAAFPAEYQQAFFMMDWTYGVMYAVHLTPHLGAYSGEVEKFLSAKPLPLTDVVIGADGAMYFTTGGRRIQSGFHRVVYRGQSDTTPVTSRPKPTYEQAMRRQMEALHRDDAPAGAVATIWNQLGNNERFVRQAARIALEHQPVERWRERALGESDPNKAAMALMALSRHSADADRGALGDALAAVDRSQFDEARRSVWVRAWALTFARTGRPTDAERTKALDALDALYPSGDVDLDAQLVDLLVFLHAPGVIERALDRMDALASGTPPAWADLARRNDQYGSAIRAMLDNPPPTAQMQIARALSFENVGWTMPQRQRYLSLLNRASAAGGGMSLQGYLDRMRERHMASASEDERSMLAPMAHAPRSEDNAPVIVPVGPGRVWTVDEAAVAIDAVGGEPDLARGGGLFRASQCSNCHTMAGKGANAGPDLTSAGNTFSRTDILRAIIEPSASVTDQYAISVVQLKDGQTRRGLMVDSDQQRVLLAIDFLNPQNTVEVPRSEIASITPSPVSPMPPGLVNALNPRELRDLVSFVISGGH